MRSRLISRVAVIAGLSCVSAATFSLPLFARAQTSIASGEVTTANLSLGDPKAAFRLINGRGEWKSPAGRFAKLEIRFLEPVPLSRVEALSCEKPFSDGAEIYVNFEHTRVFTEGGKTKLVFSFGSEEAPLPVSSLVLSFRYSSEICLKALNFFKGASQIVPKTPEVQEVLSETPLALFDSKLESTWAPKDSTSVIELKFPIEMTVTRLRVWNGDQRGGLKFRAAPRAKTLSLRSEDFKETLSLEDKPGLQALSLKTEFKGKSIKIAIDEAFAGAVGDAKIAELQLGNKDGFFSADIATALLATAAARRSAFETASLGGAVDGDISVNEDGDVFSLRARSDGSFYMRGRSENLRNAGAFSFLGTYSVLEATSKRIRVKVDGTRWSRTLEFDSSVCGRECAGATGPGGTFVEDEVSFGRGKDGTIFVRDEGRRRATGLDFRPLKTRIRTEAD